MTARIEANARLRPAPDDPNDRIGHQSASPWLRQTVITLKSARISTAC